MTLPERLGRLERVERIGVGGFATVWLYHDAELRSDVAVKALADNWAQRLDVRERFLEEARILRRADSDHVVRVYDIGEVDSTPYFVMTYADLGSLAQQVEEGVPLPSMRVVDLVEQAATGLAVLHELGVVHRDVKPQNLLLRSGGSAGDRLLVADLGVAKAMLHASGLTQVVGTPAYMAPEQVTGEGIDTRADVHALAAVAYQLLTGRLARTGSVADLMNATLPVAPSRLADLPTAVDDVLLRSLDPDPDRRHRDVGSLAADLSAALPRTVTRDRAAAQVSTTRLHEPPTVVTDPSPPARRGAPVLLTLICCSCWGRPSRRRTPWCRCCADRHPGGHAFGRPRGVTSGSSVRAAAVSGVASSTNRSVSAGPAASQGSWANLSVTSSARAIASRPRSVIRPSVPSRPLCRSPSSLTAHSSSSQPRAGCMTSRCRSWPQRRTIVSIPPRPTVSWPTR